MTTRSCQQCIDFKEKIENFLPEGNPANSHMELKTLIEYLTINDTHRYDINIRKRHGLWSEIMMTYSHVMLITGSKAKKHDVVMVTQYPTTAPSLQNTIQYAMRWGCWVLLFSEVIIFKVTRVYCDQCG